MARRLLAGLAVLTAGCSSTSEVWVVPDLPEEIELGALLVSGEPTGSELELRVGGVFELELPTSVPEGSVVYFVGYSRAEIERTGWSDAANRRVHLAGADDPVLPPAVFAARAKSEGPAPSFTIVEPPPEVSGAWLPSCPVSGFDEPFFVHTNCDSAPCAIEAKVTDCDVQLNLGACAGLPTLRATMNGRGEVDFGQLSFLGQCRSRDFGEAEAAPLLSVECTLSSMAHSCRIDAYADEPREYIEDLRRLKLSEVPSMLGTDDKGRPADGYIGGIAFIEDGRRLVAAVNERYTSSLCQPRSPSQIVIVDPDLVEVVGTATAPDCLRQLVADPAPGRDGFIGVFRDDASQGRYAERIGRFDRRGRLLESVALDLPELDRNGHQLGVIGVQINFDSTPALFATFEIDGSLGQSGYLVRLDPISFAPIWAVETDQGIRDITAMRDEDLGYLESTNESVIVVDWSGQHRYSYDVTLACADQGLDPADFASIYGANPEILVFGRDRRPAVLLIDQQQNCSIIPFFEWPALVSNGHLWPNTELWVVALEEVGTSRASLALFDPNGPRFLPGAWDIGEGSVRIIDRDAERRIWVTLNDTAELVRVTPIQ